MPLAILRKHATSRIRDARALDDISTDRLKNSRCFLAGAEADTAGQVAGSLRLRSASAAVGAALSAAGRLSGASAALAAGGARLSSTFRCECAHAGHFETTISVFETISFPITRVVNQNVCVHMHTHAFMK